MQGTVLVDGSEVCEEHGRGAEGQGPDLGGSPSFPIQTVLLGQPLPGPWPAETLRGNEMMWLSEPATRFWPHLLCSPGDHMLILDNVCLPVMRNTDSGGFLRTWGTVHTAGPPCHPDAPSLCVCACLLSPLASFLFPPEPLRVPGLAHQELWPQPDPDPGRPAGPSAP